MMSLLGVMVFPREGGEVDGLAYPLHRPTTNSCLPRRQGLPVRRSPVLSR
jgi:hypothetical protein